MIVIKIGREIFPEKAVKKAEQIKPVEKTEPGKFIEIQKEKEGAERIAAKKQGIETAEDKEKEQDKKDKEEYRKKVGREVEKKGFKVDEIA